MGGINIASYNICFAWTITLSGKAALPTDFIRQLSYAITVVV